MLQTALIHDTLVRPPVTTPSAPLFEIRVGDLAVKMADDPAQVHAAQRLRYKYFLCEVGAKMSDEVRQQQRDFDEYDDYFDHLLVLDYGRPADDRVVGTYRMMRRTAMKSLGHFYSESEFDITPIKQTPGEILELGRSCVHPNYRNRSVMNMLWRGIGAYSAHYQIQVMFGCASFTGANPEEHVLGLSYLHHFHLAPKELRAKPLDELKVKLELLPPHQINVREVFNSLPPLIKGYIRLGGFVGEGAIIDKQCNTTDVCIIVRTESIADKYMQRYQPDGGK